MNHRSVVLDISAMPEEMPLEVETQFNKNLETIKNNLGLRQVYMWNQGEDYVASDINTLIVTRCPAEALGEAKKKGVLLISTMSLELAENWLNL